MILILFRKSNFTGHDNCISTIGKCEPQGEKWKIEKNKQQSYGVFSRIPSEVVEIRRKIEFNAIGRKGGRTWGDFVRTAEDTIELNTIEILKRSDRTFIGKFLQILYRKNLSEIKKRTLAKKTGENKVISPLKMKIITAMMIKRVNKVSDLSEKAERANQHYINVTTSKSLYYLKQTMNKSE